MPASACVYVMLQLWILQPPLAEWIRRGQPAHTPPQRPPVAEGKGKLKHKGRKRDGWKQGTDWSVFNCTFRKY
eukprot:360643-Chlamydomonas_euryale.AAC.12